MQVAEQGGQQIVVGDGLGAEVPQRPGGRLRVVEAVLQDARPAADDLDPLRAGGRRRAPPKDVLQIVPASVRLGEPIECGQGLGIFWDRGQDRLVGFDRAVRERQLFLVDRRDLEAEGPRPLTVGVEIGLALQTLDHLRPEPHP